MCKHLCGLGEFLKTKITPEAPEPEDEPPVPKKKPTPKQTLPPSKSPPTSKAPTPDDTYDDTYDDSRTGSETLMEGVSPLYARFEAFSKSNPEFDVMYEDDTD